MERRPDWSKWSSRSGGVRVRPRADSANIGEMTAKKVDAAVAAIARRDPSIGEWAQVAADDLTAGEGEEMLTQAGVQDFLWYRLPAKYPDRLWLPIARAARALLNEFGLNRYAAIAGSATTGTVLEAWGEDDTRGIARYRAAAEASGVKSPDTELLAWGSVMGLDEASAYSQTEWELERAIVAGALVPGSSGWKSRAASLTEQALRGTAPNGAGRRWHQQKPESARTVSWPVAPAERTRPIVSRRKWPALRPALALPSRRRAISTSPVPAAMASSG